MSKLRELLGLKTSQRQHGCLVLQPSDVDHSKIAQYRQRPELIQAIHDWYTMPDKLLLPQMLELAGMVKQIERLRGKLDIYRGFNPGSPTQNTMGYGGEANKLNVGDTFMYGQNTTPVSFSTDIGIASTYGKVVIRSEVDHEIDNVLVFTNELAYLVCELQGKSPVSQKEVIMLPPFKVPCFVHLKK